MQVVRVADASKLTLFRLAGATTRSIVGRKVLTEDVQANKGNERTQAW